MKKSPSIAPRVIRMVIFHTFITGIALLVFALLHHVLPMNGIAAQDNIHTPSQVTSDSNLSESALSASDTDVQPLRGLYRSSLSPFTTEVVTTDLSYTSENVAITLETVDTGSIVYHIADIYVNSIENLRTAFAMDTYGKGYRESPVEVAVRNNALLAVNGDYYGNMSSGVVIRNGILYRDSSNSSDICVLFRDGHMETYSAKSFNAQKAIEEGAWQAWQFGPSLLSSSGGALTKFNSRVTTANPRTAIGYYEEGHYCFVCVDGRSESSDGMTLKQLSALFESLGCKSAYNLDGGQTSMMVWQGEVFNSPYKGGRKSSDIAI